MAAAARPSQHHHAAALAFFDVPSVEAKAEAALAAGGATGVEEARKLFEETLAEWGDEYARLLEEADPPLASPEVGVGCLVLCRVGLVVTLIVPQ
jgi:hypothetical protein